MDSGNLNFLRSQRTFDIIIALIAFRSDAAPDGASGDCHLAGDR